MSNKKDDRVINTIVKIGSEMNTSMLEQIIKWAEQAFDDTKQKFKDEMVNLKI